MAQGSLDWGYLAFAAAAAAILGMAAGGTVGVAKVPLAARRRIRDEMEKSVELPIANQRLPKRLKAE